MDILLYLMKKEKGGNLGNEESGMGNEDGKK